MNNKQPTIDGIAIKKKYGQHFLQDQAVLRHCIEHIDFSHSKQIFEIGGGSGALTRLLLQQPIDRLWVFEIDTEWAHYLMQTIHDPKLTVYEKNFLDLDHHFFETSSPNVTKTSVNIANDVSNNRWSIVANLPYNITFPILHKLVIMQDLLYEGVIMIQEEVAQKLVKTHGRDYGFVSLYFRYFFEWKLLEKIPPSAFYPAPKVFSRLLHFKPRSKHEHIDDPEAFWKFIKFCFKQPRRTLENNLKQSHYQLDCIEPSMRLMRAQQLSFEQLLALYNQCKANQ